MVRAMSTPHKATPDQWHNLHQYLKLERIPDHISIMLELAARVEALEQAKSIIDKPAPAPASSLVERVADAIVTKATSAGIVDDRPARAAIREVAAWLRDRADHWSWVAQVLEREAGR
jgi:nitrate reductase assembly molybdenum cofactor insertion protein NarJ